MPVARSSWFSGGVDCRVFIPTLLASAPQAHRGTWRYSNGIYCTLGILVVSTNDLTAMTAQLRPGDIETLRPPGIFVDQYGWGHTGTMDGAVSCLWILEDGRTTVAATIAGNSPAKGGDICDRVVPAVAGDLGISQGPPIRTP